MDESRSGPVLFEVRGPDSYKTYRDFQFFALLKNKFIIIALTIILLSALTNIWHGYFADGLLGIFLILFWWVFMTLYIHIITKKHMEAPLYRQGKGEEQYLFYQDYFVNTDPASQSIIRYDMLLKAYETKKYFYLYIEHNRAHIVEKAHFIYNTPEEMRKFLREKLGDKFHIKTK